MNNKSDIEKNNIDIDTLVVLYAHYKEFFLPVGIIVVSVLLLFFFVISGVQNYFNVQSLAKSETQKLVILKNNLSTLSNLDDNQLNQNLTVLSAALPSDKDFAGIINAINTDAALTGVSVGDFNLNVGNLSSAGSPQGSYPTLQVEINLAGSANSVLDYMQQLAKTVPLSEVTDIRIGQDSADLILQFYFKPFIAPNVSDETPIQQLSTKDLGLISEISAWNNSAPLNLEPSLSSSTSASIASSSALETNPSPF